MTDTHATPVKVATGDKPARRRAAIAVAVGRAYVGDPLWWLCMIIFTILSVFTARLAWTAHHADLGTIWTVSLVAAAMLCLVLAIAYVPLGLAWSIYRARDLYYLDTGSARAALATPPDNRRGALPDDVQAQSFGAWPRNAGAGRPLGEWVREDVHKHRGRLTATALPGMAARYIVHGMVDEGRRTAFLFHRVASKPRTTPPA